MHIYSPESLLTQLSQGSTIKPMDLEHTYVPGQRSRRKYAHVRVVDEADTETSSSSSKERLVFHIILEPLIMGILPVSMVPTVLVLFLVSFMAILTVPWIYAHLEEVAAKAREADYAHASNRKEE